MSTILSSKHQNRVQRFRENLTSNVGQASVVARQHPNKFTIKFIKRLAPKGKEVDKILIEFFSRQEGYRVVEF